jgi:hypothetical protein
MLTQDRTVTIGAYTFDEKEHLHMLDGKHLTGVTTILGVIAKPMLIQWAANMACDYIKEKATPFTHEGKEIYSVYEEILKEARVAHRKKKESAGEFGTNVHNAIETFIKGLITNSSEEPLRAVLNTLTPLELKAVEHFTKWAQDNKVKFLESEKHVYSRSLWVGGICDIVCEIDGKRYVADIKTSSGIYPEAFIQCSAYAKMLEEMGMQVAEHENEVRPDLYSKFDGVLILNCNKKGGFEHAFNYDIEGNFECFKAAVKIYRQMNAIKC